MRLRVLGSEGIRGSLDQRRITGENARDDQLLNLGADGVITFSHLLLSSSPGAVAERIGDSWLIE
jgi:hypothetical protein